LKIVKAEKESIARIISVINDSIENLCHQDHLNKKKHLDEWLNERSQVNLENQLFHDNTQTFVCVDKGKIIGVSQIDKSGDLKLCYVHSQYTGIGAGRLLLVAAENQAKEWGLKQVSMVSTRTAHDFYQSQGYINDGKAVACIGMPGYPLVKSI